MPTFRAYLLNTEGRITWGDWIDAATEAEAMEKAKALCREGVPTVEIWQGTRKVGEDHCHPEPKAKTKGWLPKFARRVLRAS